MADLVAQLSAFDRTQRQAALDALLQAQPGRAAEKAWVNMHLHTFFSYNGEGWSPSRLAWEARQQGLAAAGICDFDVLAGLGEWQAATDQLAVRGAAGFESRVFFKEFAEHELNSPGEPGVLYFMGFGFVSPPAPKSAAAGVLEGMLAQSHSRNRELLARVNARLGDLALNYETDVLPLTPAGNATERHIVRAYYDKALAQAGGDLDKAAVWWAGKLNAKPEEIAAKIRNTNGFVDLLRSKMMKKGGLGYVQPTADTFPLLDTVIPMILACDAIPMLAWLDGTSSGEAAPQKLLECAVAKGIESVNIIPDRNWNFKDPAESANKARLLNEFVAACVALDLPINVGTELNKPGQRFVDDFEAAPMKPHQPLFLAGAQVMVGQTRLLRYAKFGYCGAAAKAEFPGRRERNAFFAAVGALPAPDAAGRAKLAALSPDQAFACLSDSARAARWS